MLYKYGFFFRFKMKVGGDIEDDIKRASTIRKIIGYDNDLVWEITQMSTGSVDGWLADFLSGCLIG